MTTHTCVSQDTPVDVRYLKETTRLYPKTMRETQSSRMLSQTTLDLPGSDGMKEVNTQDIESCMEEKPSSVLTFNTEYTRASHTKWGQRVGDNTSSQGSYTRVPNRPSRAPMLTITTSTSSLEIPLSTSLSNKRWSDLKTQACWPKSGGCGPFAHAFQSMLNLCNQYKTSPLPCISSTNISTTKSDKWSYNWKLPKDKWRKQGYVQESNKSSQNLCKIESSEGNSIGQDSWAYQNIPTGITSHCYSAHTQ